MAGHRSTVAIASDLSLVAETVRTALEARGYECHVLRWGRADKRPADGGLLICDASPSTRLCEGLRVVKGTDYAWLLLTSAPAGPVWGAALEGGVVGIVASASTLDEVDAALQRLLAGEALHDPEQIHAWVQDWHETRARKAVLLGRVESLTPRERTVLRLMYSGQGVRDIANTLELSEATVRSHVKAVLKKFRVNSQLDAVAVLGWLRDDPETLSC